MKTSSSFIINDKRDFEVERIKLINYIIITQDLGAAHFTKKKHKVFGIMTSEQWNNFFSKHLNHHLEQFGV